MGVFDLIRPTFYRNRWYIVIGVGCLIVVDMLQLVVPRIIKHAIDGLTTARITVADLGRYGLWIIGIALAMGSLRYVWRRCLIGMSRQVEEELRNSLFSHIQLLSATYFDRMKTGDIMAHATNDITHIRMAVGMGMVALTDAIVMGCAAIGFMLYIHVELTLWVILPMPLIVVGTRVFSRLMHARYQQVQAAFSDLTEAVREVITAIRLVKSHHTHAFEMERIGRQSQAYISKNIALVRITGSLFPMMVFFSNISLVLILYVGGRNTIYNRISPGDFVAFISYLGLLTWPMMAMGWVTNLIQRGKASIDRIDRILRTMPEIADPKQAAAVSGIQGGHISFERVTMAYPASEATSGKPVLIDIDLDIPAGSFLGIAGPPGSGKSTLISLIPRLYDPGSGEIRIDGISNKAYRLDELRSNIAFLPQEPFLFSGTIRDNILMSRDDIDDAAIWEAVRISGLEKTIQTFPKGLDTIVGEKGVMLSGGQKQRVALARCFIGKPKLLILDDPVSQVDIEIGQSIIRSIQDWAKEATVILVSHRMAALRPADHIVVLDRGRIVESGSHETLITSNGYYASIFRLQEIEECCDAR
ncbi:ABC transporter ATP-binding protein [Desulfatirhabdium butyrativorans]|uniref:ABC transporter ATP-binding protein n=1 Tax=Desulfatirhabdium butyrativorans TaxID=340467 RepID=UPI00040D9988|nr:ABC transporter ATP-binding protein [Desulfatirhabdium butyrativorans]